jgi:hypothetical protein
MALSKRGIVNSPLIHDYDDHGAAQIVPEFTDLVGTEDGCFMWNLRSLTCYAACVVQHTQVFPCNLLAMIAISSAARP